MVENQHLKLVDCHIIINFSGFMDGCVFSNENIFIFIIDGHRSFKLNQSIKKI